MKQFNILERFDLAQVKRDFISSIINFVYGLPHELRSTSDLEFLKILNIRKISKLGGDRALCSFSLPEIKFWIQQPKIIQN